MATQAVLGMDKNLRTNLCLNPSFEAVLPGSHTAAITTLTGSITTKNCQFPGWKLKTLHADDSIVVVPETSIISPTGSQQSVKATIANVTGKPQLVQYWTAAEYLSNFVAGTIGRYFTFAVDVRQSEATANAARLFVTTDGGGVVTTYSAYHTNADDTWERLLVSVLVPAATTYVYFGVSFESTTPLYYIDNAMVEVSDAALTDLPYQPRPPVNILQTQIDSLATYLEDGTTDANLHVSGDGAASHDLDFNAVRPAWATGSAGSAAITNTGAGGAGQIMQLRPNGYSNWTAIIAEPNKGVTNYAFITVDLGADGQIQWQVTAAGVPFDYFISKWFGLGL